MQRLFDRIFAYWNASSDGWHLSIVRILWCYFHFEFAAFTLKWTVIQWHLPLLPYPGPLQIFSLIPNPLFIAIITFHTVATLCILLGWHTRLFQWLIVCTSITMFFHTASTYHNHHGFYLFITLFLACMATNRFYALDARRQDAHLDTYVSLFPQRLIQLQLSFLYLFAALNKIDPAWFERWTKTPELLSLTQSPLFASFWKLLLEHQIAWAPFVLIIATLLFLSVGIFFAHRFPLIALLGVVMHVLFSFSLPIIEFTRMCMVIWFLALFPAAHPFVKEFESYSKKQLSRITGIR